MGKIVQPFELKCNIMVVLIRSTKQYVVNSSNNWERERKRERERERERERDTSQIDWVT